MFTRPADVADAELVAVLAEGWGIDVVSLDYLAVGFGSHHWRAATASTEWFVTVDDLTAKRREPGETVPHTRARLYAALATAAELRDDGYGFVVAPVRCDGGQVATDFGYRYVVTLYPLVDGQKHAYGRYSDPHHRDAVVALVAELHRSPQRCRRWALTETFSIARRAELFDACSHPQDRWESGPFGEPARQLLAGHAPAVERAFERYDSLAKIVRSRPDRFVLTHGEPHPANTITTDRGVMLVDWDTTLIAPPERDLWDLTSEDASVAGRYESRTGVGLDPRAIELYRLAWDLSEIAICVSDFRQPHERTDDTAEGWQNLQHFLDPTRW